MIFDTHAHYDDKQFDEDRDQILSSMQEQGIGTIVDASATVDSWERVLELTRRYSFVYGKIGLDYYWDKEQHEIQKEWFICQLQLARKLNMPVNIHSREAAQDTMEIMKEHAADMKAIIHCYSYSKEMAEEYVKMGYLLGIGGVVTFKNAKKLKEVVKAVPLSHIVLETDCPYLAPEPNRGKRNASSNLIYVAQTIAELKGTTTEEVIAVTEENARKFYGLDK